MSPGPFWALSPEEALAELGADPGGLDEREAAERFERYGPNELEEGRRAGVLALLLRQFRSPLIYILLLAALVTLLLRELVDTAVIAAVLILNAAIGFSQEHRAERSMEALRRLARARARVLRGARERELDATLLVPGDVVLLEAGAKVPADCRLLHAAGLETDESLLTGESVPVAKGIAAVSAEAAVAERHCMAFMGTTVNRGHARALVVATGPTSELGRIAGSLREIGEVATPLQRQIVRFAHLIGGAVLAACAVGLIAGLAAGEAFGDLALALVALSVAAIPEGLPIVLTVALAISMRRMAARRAIIRRLPAVETLGSCSAIGSDKTGTLTQNRMTLRALVIGDRRYDATVQLPIGDEGLRLTLLAGALCNDASAVPTEEGFDVAGDPTEVALLVGAAKAELFKDELEERFTRFGEIPFDSDLRYMATFNRGEDGAFVFVKGAPEEVLAMCGAADRSPVLAAAEELASDGMRVLASAYRRLEDDRLALPEELDFLGLFGLIDPPREEAVAAVRGCRQAGIRVLMITGDHAATAAAIARQLGIAADGDTVATGTELDGLDEQELDELVGDVSVFARVSPQHKLAIVEALRRRGHTVAVTGDGVNDAPALKAADIGVAMGKSGTDVAKEAADMVVTDDNFASIVAAVEEGRVAFDNVRKTTFFLISTGAAAIIAVLASIFGRFDAPFVAAQMIWLNVVTNGVQDVALAFEPGEKDVLRRRPRPRTEGVISPLLWERTALAGLVMAVGTLALFLHELHAEDDLHRARTIALTTMVLFQVFHVGNSRSEHLSAFRKSPFSNRFLFLGTTAALVLHVAALHLPFTQFALRVEPLDVRTWIEMVAVASSVILAVELHKLVRKPAAAVPVSA